jgi:hypothetical protein
MGLQYEQDNSLSERIKREISHPSKRTLLIVVVVLLLAVSPVLAGVIDTASEGIETVTAEHDLVLNMNMGPGDLSDEQIAPWLASQGEIMMNATGPLEWDVNNYRFGPCEAERIGEITPASYGDSIREACGLMYDIQGLYSRDCYLATTCDVTDKAKGEIAAVIDILKEAHSSNGFVWVTP